MPESSRSRGEEGRGVLRAPTRLANVHASNRKPSTRRGRLSIMSPVRVLLDRPAWNYQRGSTDYAYIVNNMSQLGRFQSDIDLELYGRARSALKNGIAVAAAARRRLHPARSPTWSHRLPLPTGYELVYANDAFPLRAKQPVIWQNTLVDPEMRRARGISEVKIEHEAAAKRPLFASAARTIVSTDSECRRIENQFPELIGRVQSCPFYLPFLTCEPGLLRKHHARGPVEVLFVGNEARRKGLPELLLAWRLIRPKNARLTVISHFSDGAVDFQAGSDVRVLAGVSHKNVLENMRKAHILVNPAHYETYGFVFIEAFALGAVAVGPSWETQRELFADGSAGVHVSPTPQVLGAALGRLVEDAAARHQLARSAMGEFTSRYAPEIVAGRLVSLFRAVVAGK